MVQGSADRKILSLESLSGGKREQAPDHLVFARILSLMADEHRSFPSEYDRLRYYAKPAYEQYQLAAAEGQEPTSQELEFIQWLYNDLTYKFEHHDEHYENHVKRITGHEKMGDFYFHDSKAVHFEHDCSIARITLLNDSVKATFRFDDVETLEVNTMPGNDYVLDFYCYPARYSPDKRLIVELDFYTIDCSAMVCESVEGI